MKKLHAILFFIFFYHYIIAQTPQWQWAKSASASSTAGTVITNIASDNSFNFYATGGFKRGTIIFDNDTLNCVIPASEQFLAKYSPNGNIIWAKNNNGSVNSSNGGFITSDHNGNLIFGGGLSDTISWDSDTLICNHSGYDVFLSKFDPNGNVLWLRKAGGSGGSSIRGVSTDLSGNIYVTGDYQATSFTIGSFSFINPTGDYIFMAKYDSSGTVLWAKTAGNVSANLGYWCATDSFANVYVTGIFTAPYIVFDSDTVFHSGSVPNDFLAKFDSSGHTLWVKNTGRANGGTGAYVVTDSANNVYITVRDANFTYLEKYDPIGNLIWFRADSSMFFVPLGLSTNKHNRVYMTFYPYTGNDTITIDTVTLISHGVQSYFIVAFDTSGHAVWGKVVESGLFYPFAVAAGSQGCVYAGGDFVRSPFVLDTIGLTASSPQSNVFVGKLCEQGFPLDVAEDNKTNATIYPNPFSSSSSIYFNSPLRNAHVTIYDMVGKLVFSKNFSGNRLEIERKNLESDVYLLKVVSEEGQWVEKLVVE